MIFASLSLIPPAMITRLHPAEIMLNACPIKNYDPCKSRMGCIAVWKYEKSADEIGRN